jgi:hypothetical protein
MSEDTTNILSNEESKAPATNPMLEAILAKVNDLVTRVDEGFAQVDSRFAEVNARIDGLTTEMKEVKRNQRVFNDQLLNLQGSQREIEDRLDDHERKAS